MDTMRRSAVSADELRAAATTTVGSVAALNLLPLVGADAARRHGHAALAAGLASQCSNPALAQLSGRWERRQQDRHVRERRGTGS